MEKNVWETVKEYSPTLIVHFLGEHKEQSSCAVLSIKTKQT